MEPSLIVCDEPVSALDVSIQAQIINLLEDLQRELGLTYLFVAHDLSVVRHISDRVAVMYLGRIVELTDRKTLYDEPRAPLHEGLLSAVPIPDPETGVLHRERIVLSGEVPSPLSPPSGCVFHPALPDRRGRAAPGKSHSSARSSLGSGPPATWPEASGSCRAAPSASGAAPRASAISSGAPPRAAVGLDTRAGGG